MDLACQLGLWLPAWTVESYVSIPPQFHNKSLARLSLTFRGVAPPDFYISGGLTLLKLGRKREVGY
jgi:hypothetical protein